MFCESFTYYLLWVLVFSFSAFVRILVKISETSTLTDENVDNRFDYVVVGGGSAGSIVAGRLSENPNVTVLLVEAGGYGFDILNIPVLGPLKQLSDLDWQYTTVPQNRSCFGLENNVSKWPSGKILGGSTHLNYMIYLKGHKNDYGSWKDPNSSEWSPEDVDYYYKKGFKCTGKGCTNEKGSMVVRENGSHTTELSDALLEAVKELQYPVNELNSGSRTGFTKPQLNINEFGRRWTSDQYVRKKQRERKNLKILTRSVAEEILLRNGFEAYGIRLRRGGKEKIVFANLEVILCAGTIGSAKLLLQSGIGPKESIIGAKVKHKIDLPVGENLQDHVTTGLDLLLLNRSVFSFTDLMWPSSAFDYFVRGSGPFTSALVDVIGVIHSPLVSHPEITSPDLEFMALVAGLSFDHGVFFRRSMGISEKVWDGYFRSLINESAISILPVLLHPKSKGRVILNPSDPYGPPLIDPMYLSDERDVRVLIEGIRIIQKLAETRSLKGFGVKFNTKKFPGCEDLEDDSDDYWACYVRHLTLTVYHPVGTCKMGSLEEGGVVDRRLRVHKTNRLRVMDASVMPEIPSANTNAAVVMIAEKGADLLKEDANERRSTCFLRHMLFP